LDVRGGPPGASEDRLSGWSGSFCSLDALQRLKGRLVIAEQRIVRFRRFHAALEIGFCKATANVGALLQAASGNWRR